jgi:hypothetical protein
MGVSYYPKDDSEKDNPCSGRTDGEHQFDHPFVQVKAILFAVFLNKKKIGSGDVHWRVPVYSCLQVPLDAQLLHKGMIGPVCLILTNEVFGSRAELEPPHLPPSGRV